MGTIENLRKAVNSYHERHEEWPRVIINREFSEDHTHEISQLINEGIDIEISDTLLFINFYLEGVDTDQNIQTLHDLKKVIDRMVAEGKGNWPVKSVSPDSKIFYPLHLFSVLPEKNRQKGILESESSSFDMDSEYISVVVGDFYG